MAHFIRIHDEDLYKALAKLAQDDNRPTTAYINLVLARYVALSPKLVTTTEDRMDALRKAANG